MIDEINVSGRDLAAVLGISDRAVRELHERGLVVKEARGRYALLASVTAYTEHLRGVASGRGDEALVYDLTRERARLAKEQADERELRNASLRGDLVSAEDVKREWANVIRTVRSKILAVPSRVRQSLAHLTPHDVEAIDTELRRALEDVAHDR
ncbi:DNA packaging protein [Limimaricola sp.]|uniref:DNA packaging protein n=1 Tax=Limimaricola sp. TaxID=2211665 RepID=UPI0040583F8D